MSGELMRESWEADATAVTNGDLASADATHALRYTKRLSGKIFIAFHRACDQRDVEVSQRLLTVLQMMTERPHGVGSGRDPRHKRSLVAAYERLWLIRHSTEPNY
jgi:hypothetical protein